MAPSLLAIEIACSPSPSLSLPPSHMSSQTSCWPYNVPVSVFLLHNQIKCSHCRVRVFRPCFSALSIFRSLSSFLLNLEDSSMTKSRKRGPPSSPQRASRRIAAAAAAKGTSKGTGQGNRTAKPQDRQGRQSGPQRSQVTAPSPPDQSISDAAEALVGDTTLQDNPKNTAVTKATSSNRKSNATSPELSESSDDNGPFSNLKDVQYVPSKYKIQQQQ